ncbi:MAG: hypothetical protein ACD_38C00035G0006 [uncultured bacterium]|uniref:Uncharacterized protein n=1 Tax=Candidatus Daviesbacteria bacterium GW2011_GWC2_40_12 TaxID=1618431 RepID=A0A0G0QMF5_9BACT|nr:MAG: hypothetical protein ACD_38C00035G0006 [uncultured bacterium]KKQ83321.1 MAG: hypothetical protein UT04_C0033G0004 [Candidatus Daviesbacteria bacterium GW2011_GWF2_38_7]KKR41323.1 MAG: hypothetical protein UT77_C0014G0020 [Candidatus Daviesbacteria bacterium GW2011_GWC2_40_12]OGE21909.1 MAG: hypothetical protein A2778_00175 [Candidatus Daviesbacteria bacterium RIFCSPHIGHO2_01_FULL_40_24]OGE29141.1 MAG: hypothetical protein A3C29_04890 [Candidatus Daviesbacteria bacterium RIFCSPHIGHO2_02_
MLQVMSTMKGKEVRNLKKSAQVHKGFTLVELLVVIAIIAILAAVVVLIINPLELTRRGRDAARLSDLSNLQQAINVTLQEATGSATEILCKGGICTGNSVSDSRAADGDGWVKANLSAQTSVSVPILPVDPASSPNTAANHYTYCSNGDTWKIVTDLESTQQTPKETQDGGTNTTGGSTGTGGSDNLYEVGSNMALTCAY